MNGYEKAQKLGLIGTDEEIVAILQTLAANDLPVSHVAEWLRVRKLWYAVPDGFAGPLQLVYDSPDTPAQVREALGEFFASVWGRGAEYIRATWPQYGPQIWGISGLVATLIQGGETLREELYAAFGGRPYASLTVEEFAAQRAAAEDHALRQKSYSEIVARANAATAAAALALDGDAAWEEIIHAGFAAWENWTEPEAE